MISLDVCLSHESFIRICGHNKKWFSFLTVGFLSNTEPKEKALNGEKDNDINFITSDFDPHWVLYTSWYMTQLSLVNKNVCIAKETGVQSQVESYQKLKNGI